MFYTLKAAKKMTDDGEERDMRRACNKSYIFMAQAGGGSPGVKDLSHCVSFRLAALMIFSTGH